MTLDAGARMFLDLLAGGGGPALEDLAPADARLTYAGLSLLAGEGAAVASVAEHTIAGVPAHVITPLGDGPFPVLVWLHGGGWVLGAASESVPTCKDLAAAAGCIVVSLHYRLAPEHVAPAAMDDCIAAVGWLLEHAGDLGGDPARVAVGGESAGGNLSALLAQHFGPRLRLQLLVCPATDLTGSHPSIEENAEGYLLTKSAMQWFIGQYLGGTGIAGDDPRVSPLAASDATLAATAPAVVITAGFDPLRDEGDAYAARLSAAGVPVVHRRYDEQIHLFFSLPAVIPQGAEALALAAEQLRAAFNG